MPDGGKKLAIDFCGMQFDTPLVLLSGCVGFGEEYTRVKGFSNRDAGAVCLKGTTLEPRLGNPRAPCRGNLDGYVELHRFAKSRGEEGSR